MVLNAAAKQDTAVVPKIEIKNLNFYYGKFHALRDVNMSIAKIKSPHLLARRVAANRPCYAP